jgi:hypothetical protein
MNRPQYPVYIISKGRYENPITAKYFIKNKLSFKIAVEPQEYDNYVKSLSKKYVVSLPFSNLGVGSFPARNWCWEDSIKKGYDRHWLFDDNIRGILRFNKGNRFLINPNIALKIVEDFTDRYENIGISGFNYHTFTHGANTRKPFRLNHHIYSGMLIYNKVNYRWRLKYNEDVDLNLQYLVNRWCLVQFLALSIMKQATMTMKGGNTDILYKDDGRLKMARSLESLWPEYVQVKWRYGRPQHVVNWKKYFQHPLIRKKDIDWEKIKSQRYDMRLTAIKNIKSDVVKRYLNAEN